MAKRMQDDDQDRIQASGPSLAAQVDQLIRDGFLPAPTIRLAVGNTPVWSFPAICQLFDIQAPKLIDAIVTNGPAHRPDDKGIPSSWQLFMESGL